MRKHTNRKNRDRRVMGTALIAAALVLAAMAAVASQSNLMGGLLGGVASDTDSAAPLMESPSGAKVSLAGAGQGAPDLANAAGARAYPGHLDPAQPSSPRAAEATDWNLY